MNPVDLSIIVLKVDYLNINFKVLNSKFLVFNNDCVWRHNLKITGITAIPHYREYKYYKSKHILFKVRQIKVKTR